MKHMVVFVVFLIFIGLIVHFYPFSYALNLITFAEYCSKNGTNNIISNFLFNYGDLTSVLFAFAIIVLKRTDDMIQGISKLDHLVKISIFQRNKIGQAKSRYVSDNTSVSQNFSDLSPR